MKGSTQMRIFFHWSDHPQIIVYLRSENFKNKKNKNNEEQTFFSIQIVSSWKNFKLQSSIYIKYIYIYSQENVHILGWMKHSIIGIYILYLKFLKSE